MRGQSEGGEEVESSLQDEGPTNTRAPLQAAQHLRTSGYPLPALKSVGYSSCKDGKASLPLGGRVVSGEGLD